MPITYTLNDAIPSGYFPYARSNANVACTKHTGRKIAQKESVFEADINRFHSELFYESKQI